MTKKEMVNVVEGMGVKANEDGIYVVNQAQFKGLINTYGKEPTVSKKDATIVNFYDDKKKNIILQVKVTKAKVYPNPNAKAPAKTTAKAPAKAKVETATKATADTQERVHPGLKKGQKIGSFVSKEVGNGYVVFYQLQGKNKKKNSSLFTCAEIKELIKKLHKEGKVILLKVYKMGENFAEDNSNIIPTRMSAWVM